MSEARERLIEALTAERDAWKARFDNAWADMRAAVAAGPEAERDEGLRDEEAWLRSMVEPTVHSDAEFARWAIQRCYDRLALVLSRTEKEPDNGEPRTYLGSFDCWPPRQEAE